MLEIASDVLENRNAEDSRNEKHLTHALTGKKLCYQINHSDILDDVIENVFDEYRVTAIDQLGTISPVNEIEGKA